MTCVIAVLKSIMKLTYELSAFPMEKIVSRVQGVRVSDRDTISTKRGLGAELPLYKIKCLGILESSTKIEKFRIL